MKFEEKLIMLRKQKMLSQEEMAEELEVTRQTISKWELGQSKPDMEKLGKISKCFGVDVNILADDEKDIEAKQTTTNTPSATKIVKKERKGLLYLFLIVFIGAIIALVVRVNLYKQKNQANNKNIFGIFGIFENVQQVIENKETQFGIKEEEFNKEIHNVRFEFHTGTNVKSNIESMIDDIITYNKTNPSHIVALVYDNESTTDEKELKNIKHSLPERENEDRVKYEVSTEYSEDGYVNKIVLEKIK